MTTTDVTHLERSVPLAYNGWAVVAQSATFVPASEVRVGDVLILPNCVSLVQQVNVCKGVRDVGMCTVVWIHGDINIMRSPHELMTVIRRPEPHS